MASTFGWKPDIAMLCETMIFNVIDRRNRPHRWKRINAIIEAVENDNACEDSDQAPWNAGNIDYDHRKNVSVAEAVTWAQKVPTAVTLYLYDEGDGI